MTRLARNLAALMFGALLTSSLVACDKPDEDSCRQAIQNMRRLMGTEKLSDNDQLEGEVRRCKGGSSKKAVKCAAEATTYEQLRDCGFTKLPANLAVPPADTVGSAGSAAGAAGAAGSAAGSAGAAAGSAGSAGSAAGSVGAAGSADGTAGAGSAAGSAGAGSVGTGAAGSPTAGSAGAGSAGAGSAAAGSAGAGSAAAGSAGAGSAGAGSAAAGG